MSEGRAGAQPTAYCGRAIIRRREAVVTAARRYLSHLTADDIPHLPADELRDRLRKCRALLEAVVEASRPRDPLARTIEEAAAALGVSLLTVYRLVNSGDLAAYRISRRLIRIDEAALHTYLARHAIDPGGISGGDIPNQHIRPAWPWATIPDQPHGYSVSVNG